MGIHGRIARRKTLLSTKNIAAHLQFGFWNNVLWTDETEIKLFGLKEKRYVCIPG